MTDSPKGALYAALARARSKCKAAEKGSQADRYKYADAEEVFGVAADAFNGEGLALIPIRQVILDRGQPIGIVIACTFRLTHEGGESETIEREFPVVPNGGRPIDKAVATADTTSLNYLCRDMLLMRRVDPSDNMDHPVRDREIEAERLADEAFRRAQAEAAQKQQQKPPRRSQNAQANPRPTPQAAGAQTPIPPAPTPVSRAPAAASQQGGGRPVDHAPHAPSAGAQAQPPPPAPPADKPPEALLEMAMRLGAASVEAVEAPRGAPLRKGLTGDVNEEAARLLGPERVKSLWRDAGKPERKTATGGQARMFVSLVIGVVNAGEKRPPEPPKATAGIDRAQPPEREPGDDEDEPSDVADWRE